MFQKIIIKQPESEKEFEQIFRLNYETFVNEIPQHKKNADQKLVDKFHDNNQYIIAVKGELLLGMISFNTTRPFSLDIKKVSMEEIVPNGTVVAEIRLLAVKKEWRKTSITFRLVKRLFEIMQEQGISFGLISAAVEQLDFYNKLGCKPFDKMVGKEGAYYQPMYISMDNLRKEITQ